MAWYRVTLDGFRVYQQTWDTMLQTDGKADEVKISIHVGLIDQAGHTLVASETETPVMGDRNGFPHRIQAGDASPLGGLRTGNWFPKPDPWVRTADLKTDQPPLLVFQGELKEGLGVAITPVIWEWDGDPDLFTEWGQVYVDNWPKVVSGMGPIILAAATGGASAPITAIGNLIKSGSDFGLPPLFRMASSVIGSARDRPIGMTLKDGAYVFTPKLLTLTHQAAEGALRTSLLGRPAGVIELKYTDDVKLRGDYGLFFKLEKVEIPLSDGALLREYSSPGVYVIYGGAKFGIPNPQVLAQYGWWHNVVIVPDGALETVPTVPREGTVVREMSSAPVYVIKSGAKCWIPNPTILQNYGGWPAVRVVPDGGLAAIPTGAPVQS